jgi:hypothetical protein
VRESYVSKLERGKEQTNLLYRDIDALLTHRYRTIMEPHVEDGRHFFRVRVVTDNPPTRDDFAGWALRTGEILHNFHSALDHLAYRLAGAHAGEYTAFPITGNADAWHAAITPNRHGECKTLGFSSQAIKRIHALQPHPNRAAENEVLSLLRDLSNWDKHRTLQMGVAHGWANNAQVGPVQPHHVGQSYGWHNMRSPGAFENNTVLGFLEVAPDMPVQVNVALQIVFAEGTAAAERPVPDLLQEIAANIESRVFQRLGTFVPA